MIRPDMVHVAFFGRGEARDDVWLSFAPDVIAGLSGEQARCLTYELANGLGLVVLPRDIVGEVAE
ncbi:hypothetical protein ACWCWQ_35685 [Streptomyces sp. NPDC001571]